MNLFRTCTLAYICVLKIYWEIFLRTKKHFCVLKIYICALKIYICVLRNISAYWKTFLRTENIFLGTEKYSCVLKNISAHWKYISAYWKYISAYWEIFLRTENIYLRTEKYLRCISNKKYFSAILLYFCVAGVGHRKKHWNYMLSFSFKIYATISFEAIIKRTMHQHLKQTYFR
jgi:hypothetical protein